MQLQPGFKIATVTGILEAKDNKFRLSPITKNYQVEFAHQTPTKTLPPSHYLFGKIDYNKLSKLLTSQHQFTGVVIENRPNCTCIKIVSRFLVKFLFENLHDFLLY